MNTHLDINFTKTVLDNGLEVILYKDNALPLVSVNIWYRVGSANEKPGKTGFAHLFEHMMFQGSKHVEKEMHFKYIQEAGGSLNGSTSIDRTNYYETLPGNSLQLALWLESDRMGFLLDGLTQKKLDNQKDVVMNERRQRYDNQPYGLAWEILFKNLFKPDFPYHWPTIGWMTDIENYNLDDVREFFRTYYSPNNASLVIAGDINEKKALENVDKYFRSIEPVNSIPGIKYTDPSLNEDINVVHEDNVQLPRVYIAWISDHIFGQDDAPLDILSDILGSSKNSRLYKKLVHEEQLVQDISCFQYSAKLTGMFIIVATIKPGSEIPEVEKIIFNEIEKLISEGVEENEFQRVINGIKSSFIYSLQNLEQLANQINSYNFFLKKDDPFNYDLKRYNKVRMEDIEKIAFKYLKKPRVKLQIIPQK
ncbi:MAG: insulinase family protein [Melioribacteraceae bacterium]|nr:insulinase family protein [Melioribacteraceae bacterium]